MSALPRHPIGWVDAHVHLYPPEVARDPARWAEAWGERHWAGQVLDRPGRRSRQAFPDLDGLLREMDRLGIERSVLQGWYWENKDTCEFHNRFYAACLRRAPDRLIAFATVQPSGIGGVEHAREEMRKARDEGFSGLGELCPHLGGGRPADGGWREVWELAADWGWPVTLHVSEPAGTVYPEKTDTPLEDFLLLVEAHPGLRPIFAHWGGGLPFFELNRRARRLLAAAAYDTAASPLIYGRKIWHHGPLLAGAERVVFGSDFPLLGNPEKGSLPERILRELGSAELTETERAAIGRDNFLRLLGAS
ncbi:MAG: amidohydrolase [Puniceicoccaceae bacterium]|nr:MAG: amidohydrolase [Puniceicoccaceae bacterium]